MPSKLLTLKGAIFYLLSVSARDHDIPTALRLSLSLSGSSPNSFPVYPVYIRCTLTIASINLPPSVNSEHTHTRARARYREASSEEAGRAFADPIASVLSLGHVTSGSINSVVKDQCGGGSSSDFHSGTNAILYYLAANMAPDGL